MEGVISSVGQYQPVEGLFQTNLARHLAWIKRQANCEVDETRGFYIIYSCVSLHRLF